MNDEHQKLEMRLLTLLHQARDEQDGAARAELNTLLREQPQTRSTMARLLVDEQALVSSLREEGIVALVEPATTSSRKALVPQRRVSGWFSWRPIAAAAAGLVAGLFSATVVYGFVMQHGLPDEGTPVMFTNGGFEADAVPAADFVPTQTGLWSGDFTALSAGEQGITPLEGKRMVKFLRTDNRLSPAGITPSAGELWQVVDLAKTRTVLGRELSVMEVSAQFNQAPGQADEKVAFGVCAMAFSGSAADAPTVWRERRELALAQADKEELADAEPGTWQRLSAQISVPREANLLLVQLRVVRKGKGPRSPELGAQFADDVQLRALHEAPLVVAMRR